MSTSAGVNVLRYTALAVGLFYGFSHQRTITKTQKQEAAKREYDRKSKLIQDAKVEYAKLRNPQPVTSRSNQDPMDPNFDFEAWFTSLVRENP